MTVAEAKQRISYVEARRWAAYFKKHGRPGMQTGLVPEIQRGFAMVTAMLVNVNGGYKGGRSAVVDDFLPKREEEAGSSVEDAAKLLSSLWHGKSIQGSGKKLWRRPQ